MFLNYLVKRNFKSYRKLLTPFEQRNTETNHHLQMNALERAPSLANNTRSQHSLHANPISRASRKRDKGS